MKRIRLSVLRVAVVSVGVMFAWPAAAERFLTVEQALKVCFPNASSFDAETFALRPDEVKAIERESKVKVGKKEMRVWKAKQNGNVIGFLIPDQAIGKHEFIDYAVAIGTNGAVLQVEILEYREHYGGQVQQPKWRQQFAGKDARAPLKLGNDVYNITGATLSCRHVTEGIKRVLATFEVVVRPRLLPGGGLPASK